MGINAITIGIWAAAGSTGSTPTITNFYADPYWDNVVLLMHGDTLLDSSSTPLTLTNTGATVNTSTKMFGTGSLYFNGSSYLTIPTSNNLSLNGNFTIEFFIKMTSLSNSASSVLSSGVTSWASGATYLQVKNNGLISFGTYGTAAVFSITALVTNSFYHIAICRYETSIYIFVNGLLDSVHTGHSELYTFNNQGTLIGKDGWDGAQSYLNGYIDDLRITKGVARYLTNFTPPTRAFPDKYGDIQSPYDPYFNNVVTLLHNDSLLDSSGNVVALTNTNVAFVTTKGAFGAGSWYFNGAARMEGVASSNFNLYGVDMTIESWVNLSSFATNPYIVELFNYTAPISRVIIQVNAAGTVSFYIDNAGTVFALTSTVTIALDTNNHLAVSLSGTTARLFINGYLAASGTVLPVIADRICALNLGNYKAGNSNFATGFIDDVRITKGVARYTTNFNPPTASFYDPIMGDPYWNYVTLLMNGDTLSDSGPLALALTNAGVTVNTTTKKYGSGALYFNGSSYITLVDSNSFYFDGDFTIEFFFNLSTIKTSCFFQQSESTAGYFLKQTLYYDATTSKFVFNGHNPASTSVPWLSSSVVSLSSGVFYHFAITVSGSAMYMFLDGNLIGTSTISVHPANVSSMAYIGKFVDSPMYMQDGLITGYIDEFRITKGVARYTSNFTPPARALPLTIGYFTSPVTRGLILDLDNNADTSSQVFDRSSANRIGVNSGTTFVATPTGKKAMVCSGSSVVSFPDETAFRPAVFSMSFWVKTTTTANTVIFEKDDNSGLSVQTSSAANAAFGNTAGRIALNTGGVGYSSLYGSTVINDGNYHHVVVIGNGSSDKAYIDGVDVTVSATAGDPVYSTGPLYIGSRNGAYGFPGSLAHVRMFNVALTAAEVATLFNEKP